MSKNLFWNFSLSHSATRVYNQHVRPLKKKKNIVCKLSIRFNCFLNSTCLNKTWSASDAGKVEAHLRDKCCAEETITASLFLSCKALNSLTLMCHTPWEWSMWMRVCMFACLMSVCSMVLRLRSVLLHSWLLICFVGGLCFPQLCSRKDTEDPRKTLRIYRDTKGIVVKMLITMLTAMYMIVRVVESVRRLEWWME